MLAGLAAATLAVSLLVVVDSAAAVRHLDLEVERWAIGHRSPAWTTFFRSVTRFGTPGYLFVAGLVLSLLAALRSPAAGIALALATVLRPLVADGLKAAVDRPRPRLSQLVHTTDSSYPSGHALAATVFWLAVPAVLALWAASRRFVRGAAALCALVVLAVACSRVYLGVHWPSDVIGAMLYGLLLLAPLYLLGTRRAASAPVPTMDG